MNSEDEVTVKDDNFIPRSFAVFEDMRRNEQLVDFNITFENRSVIGHRLILAARIPHFREIFCTPQEEIAFNEIDPDVLESVINFAYSGEIKISHENAVALIKLSKVLKLPIVYDACWEYLRGRLHPHNVLEFRRLAKDYDCPKFMKAAGSYIEQHFEEVTSSASFFNLTSHQLEEILLHEDIRRRRTEGMVIEAVIRWIRSSESKRRILRAELQSAVCDYFLTPIKRNFAEEPGTLTSSSFSLYILDVDLSVDRRAKFCRLRRFYKRVVSRLRSFQWRPRAMHNLSANVSPRKSLIYSVYAKEHDIGKVCDIYVKQLNPLGERWLDVSSYKNCVFLNAVVCVDEVIYIFTASSLYTFELSTNEWSSSSSPRFEDVLGSGSVVCKGKIYFFGGNDPSDKVQYFDLETKLFVQEPPMTRKLSWPGVALLSTSGGDPLTSETIYVTGGSSGADVYNDVSRYNPETREWSDVPSMFYERYGHGCCHLKEKLYVCGGRAFDRNVLNSAEVFDPLTNQWHVIAFMMEPLGSLSATSYEGKLFVWGSQSSMGYGKFEIYDPITKTWETVACIREEERDTVNKIFLIKS